MPNNNPKGGSPQQCMEALALANKARLTRAALKRDLANGEQKLSDVLRADLPDWLEGEPIGRLLNALPRVGPQRADRLVRQAATFRGPGGFRTHFDVTSPVGGLTVRQRALLARVLEEDYYK